MISSLRIACVVLALGTTLQAHADSLASSASSAGSDSSGSVSDSVSASSNSSKNKKVADRDYHIVDVAKATQRPGMARVTMQANDSDLQVMLNLPQAVVEREQLRNGDLVHTRQRVYGIAFEHGTGTAFFLALNDDWVDELTAHKVSL